MCHAVQAEMVFTTLSRSAQSDHNDNLLCYRLNHWYCCAAVQAEMVFTTLSSSARDV
jgi:hypothetical protein